MSPTIDAATRDLFRTATSRATAVDSRALSHRVRAGRLRLAEQPGVRVTAARNAYAWLRARETAAPDQSRLARPLAISVNDAIDEYRARRLTSAARGEVEAFVAACVRDVAPDTVLATRKLLGQLTYHVEWCWTVGYPLTREVVLRRDIIAESIEARMQNYATSSRATARSRLFRVSDALGTGPARHVRVPSYAYRPPIAPYTSREVASLWWWAEHQRTEYRRINAHILLALGLGGGLSPAEVIALRARDVHVDDAGVVLHVTGERPRAVPMLQAWEDTVAALARATLRPDLFLFAPRRATDGGRNLVSNFVAKTARLPFPIQVPRMRATWIVTHLTHGTPLQPLAKACGFDEPRALAPYLAHVPAPASGDLRQMLRQLRGGGHD